MLPVGFKMAVAKAGFFDRAPVLKAMDGKTRRALSKFGAYVRTRARSSIRSRKKISAPGQPPSSHVGTLKKLIFFAYDAARRSVVIGPLQFRSKLGSQSGGQVLEEGGKVTATTKDGKTTILHYRPRPFMKPAFDAELPKAAGFYKE